MPAVLKYTCPVCGFAELTLPPSDYSICPCCGTEFDYDNAALNNEQLRAIWIHDGAHWFAGDEWPAPIGWNPSIQLARAGMSVELVANDFGLTADKLNAQAARPSGLTLSSTAGLTPAKAA
jgi:hypothetical protein